MRFQRTWCVVVVAMPNVRVKRRAAAWTLGRADDDKQAGRAAQGPCRCASA
jgi:hypothetical protein